MSYERIRNINQIPKLPSQYYHQVYSTDNMKYLLTLLLLQSVLMQGYSQNINFELADPQPIIQEVYSGSLLSGDIDNDGDNDLIQSGLGLNLTGQSAEASVFLNDGEGNFILKEQSFNNFFSTERMVMADLDNDDDLDIIITALNRTDFYRNDGQGAFVFDESTPFRPSDAGELITGDIDGDGDNDVIQYGEVSSSNPFALLFLNDGSGVFTESENVSFVPFLLANIEYIDLEGDGDLDIISFGKDQNGIARVAVYQNNGSAEFSDFPNSNISPHLAEEISVGDIDNDGDDDILITGISNASSPKTTLYLNDGDGQFSELINTPFPDLFASSNAFADLDNDNDLDILLIGSMEGGIPNIFSIVFENLGDNNFIAKDSLGGEYIATNCIADLNGNGRKDIIIQGFVDDTNIYWNESIISSISEADQFSFSVFPNPSNGQFEIEWKDIEMNKIEIIDLHGNVLYRDPIEKQKRSKRMDIEVPTGLYMINISGEHGNYVERLFIKN